MRLMESREITSGQKHTYIALDLLRAVAAFMVFFGHLRGFTFVEFGALPPDQQTSGMRGFFFLTRLGQEAVIVFFVLSGFLVGGHIITKVRSGDFSAFDYAIDRATRILIPLIPACLMTAGLQWYLSGAAPVTSNVIGNMIGLNGIFTGTLDGNAPLWSVAYEIWFYILGGAVGFAFQQRVIGFVSGMLIFLGLLAFTALSPLLLLFWCIGSVMVLGRNIEKPRSLAVLGIGLAVVGCWSYQLGLASKSLATQSYLPTNASQAFVASGIACLIPALGTRMAENLVPFRKLVIHLSSISYTLYLFHYPILVALEQISPKLESVDANSLAVFVLKALIVLIICHGAYYLCEAHTGAARTALKKRNARFLQQ